MTKITDQPKRKRGGQPKGDLARSQFIRMRVTREERALIESAADRRDLSLSEACRSTLIRWANRARKK